MICEITATQEEKIEAIQNRTPDQKMEREGVPVRIGGETFAVRPMVRKQAKAFRASVKQWIGDIDAAALADNEDVIGVLDLTEDGYMAAVMIAIPELAGREDWLDENATGEELADAFHLAMVFVNPNQQRAQTTSNGTASSESLMSTPLSVNSTPPTPLPKLKATSATSK